MNDPHAREAILAAAAQTHPGFAAAAGLREPSLLPLAGLVAEGLDPLNLALLERTVGFYAYLVERAAASESPRDRLLALSGVLAGDEHYRGNRDDYDEPANSFLGSVLARRVGLPIALSVIYLAVAERLGWPVVGLDYPIRFVVRYRTADPDEVWVLDPFDHGRLLDREDCVSLLRPAFGRLPEKPLRALANSRLNMVAGPVRTVTRMLKNLEGSYLRREAWAELRNVIEKLLLLSPTALGELRDLGEVCHLLGEHGLALGCLRRYLEEAPQATDRVLVEQFVRKLERLVDEP